MRRGSSNLVGSAWIKRTATAAEVGNQAAFDQLLNTYQREVKRANQRARALDARGMSSGALTQFRKGLDGQYLSQSSNLSIEQMQKNLLKAEKFLKSQTSKIKGETERRAKIFEQFKKPRRDSRGRITSQAWIRDDGTMSIKQQEELLEKFLMNKNFEELKKHLGTNIIGEAAKAIRRGVDVDNLSSLFEEYKRLENSDYDHVWKAFVQGEKHINPIREEGES